MILRKDATDHRLLLRKDATDHRLLLRKDATDHRLLLREVTIITGRSFAKALGSQVVEF